MKKASTKEKLKDAVKVAGAVILIALASPVICICVTWRVSTGKSFDVCGTGRIQEAQRKGIERSLRQEAPIPLPSRRRALTLPSLPCPAGSGRPERTRQTTADQSQSVLYGRFPAEIREMIYEYALCDFTHIHLFRRQDNRLGHYKCHSIHRPHSELLRPGIYDTGELKGFCYSALTCTKAWIPGRWQDNEITELLPLLKTCRRVYIPLSSYKTSTWHIKLTLVSQIFRNHQPRIQQKPLLYNRHLNHRTPQQDDPPMPSQPHPNYRAGGFGRNYPSAEFAPGPDDAYRES